MGRFHRKQVTSCLVVCAALSFVGCRNQQGQFANPFWSQDRVPPPSTRLVAPGTAQPYYPGDPLPPLQSSTEPAAAAPLTAFAGASTGDSTVRIPTDNAADRMASPIATESPSGSVAQASFTTPAVDPKEVSVPESTEFVEQASFWRTPEVPQKQAAVTQPSATTASANASSPQMQSVIWQPVPAQPMAPQPMVQQPMMGQPMVQQPMSPQYVVPANATMPMQPVPQPATAVAPMLPRLRFPGYSVAPAPVAMAPVPYAAQNTMPVAPGGWAQPMYPNGVPQTMFVTQLPPNYQPQVAEPEPTLAIDPSAPTTFETPSTSSADGFRPRGSQR